MAGVWRDMLPHLSLSLFNTQSNLHREEREEKLTDKKKLTVEDRDAVNNQTTRYALRRHD